MTLHREWISLLRAYGVDEQPARNVAAMVSGNLELAGRSIQSDEDVIKTIRAAQRLFNKFDLRELGVDRELRSELEQQLIHTLFLDLLFRRLTGESNLDRASAEQPIDDSGTEQATEQRSVEVLEALDRISTQLSRFDEQTQLRIPPRSNVVPHDDATKRIEAERAPSANELFEYLDSLEISNDVIMTVLSDLSNSNRR